MLKLFRKYSAVILGFLAIIVGVLLIAVLVNKLNLTVIEKKNLKNLFSNNLYQAVFLSNDQIYFGHLKKADLDFVILTDTYYVKVNEDGAGQLVKLGQIEPHAPRDEMIINKDHILFWENLKSDSPVVKTIQDMQLQGR